MPRIRLTEIKSVCFVILDFHYIILLLYIQKVIISHTHTYTKTKKTKKINIYIIIKRIYKYYMHIFFRSQARNQKHTYTYVILIHPKNPRNKSNYNGNILDLYGVSHEKCMGRISYSKNTTILNIFH